MDGIVETDALTQRKRSSTLKACHRCHRRKQRCVGYPSCTNCQAAKLACKRSSASTPQSYTALSKQELIERLLSLETQSQYPRTQSPPRTGSPDASAATNSHVVEQVPAPVLGAGDGQGREPADKAPVSQDEGLASTASQHGRARSFSAALTDSGRGPSSPARTWDKTSRHSEPDASHQQHRLHVAPPPDEEPGSQFLTIYLEGLHRRAPFLDFAEVLESHMARHKAVPSDPASRHRAFKLYMVYAFGASNMQLTCAYSSISPGDYLSTALYYKLPVQERSVIQDLEASLLTIHYQLRWALEPRIWYLIGHAMRSAIDAGMHRARYYHSLDPETAHSQRRLFWCVYVLERHICWALRRPFSITDQSIDVEETPELGGSEVLGLNPDGTPFCRQLPTGVPAFQSAASAGLRLTRIMSQLFVEIHRVDISLVELKSRVPSLLAQLEDFQSVVTKVAECDRDWLLMHYDDAYRKLVETFLEVLEPQDPLMRNCLRASGRMCRLFKHMLMKSSSGYSILFINSVFIAGLTIWYVLAACSLEIDMLMSRHSYILFRSPMLWSPIVANDLRACSSALTAMAEKNTSLRKYRNVLDSIIDSTMDHVQVTTSEPTGTCVCSNCSPKATVEDSEEPSAFHLLKSTFQRLNFEFPAQAYPDYKTKHVSHEPSGRSAAPTGHLSQEKVDIMRTPGNKRRRAYRTQESSADPGIEPGRLYSYEYPESGPSFSCNFEYGLDEFGPLVPYEWDGQSPGVPVNTRGPVFSVEQTMEELLNMDFQTRSISRSW